MKIRIGILGYGNLGKGVELNIKNNPDMELVAIFTRRDKNSINTMSDVLVESIDNLMDYQDRIDVLIICGGSKEDLPWQTPKYAEYFNVIDSFDTHARIPEHYKNVDEKASASNHLALISCGWDPGAFSFNRLMAESFLPDGESYTFWGTGVSQGHSDALRRIEGVKNAIQYTIPVEEAITKVRNGENPILTTREKHTRECYVVLEDGVDSKEIEDKIKTMPNYFDEYDTTVHFISEEELKEKHSKMNHGGFVIRSGKTGKNKENNQIIEYRLKLDSNPEFTSSILLTYARAIYRMHNEGTKGCITVFDVPASKLNIKTREELLSTML